MHHKYGKDSRKSYRPKMDRKLGNIKRYDWSPASRVIQHYKQIHRYLEQVRDFQAGM